MAPVRNRGLAQAQMDLGLVRAQMYRWAHCLLHPLALVQMAKCSLQGGHASPLAIGGLVFQVPCVGEAASWRPSLWGVEAPPSPREM